MLNDKNMSNWVKWWKDKTFIKIWTVILLSMALSLGVILINPDDIWCIASAIFVAIIGGLWIRKIFSQRIDEWANKK